MVTVKRGAAGDLQGGFVRSMLGEGICGPGGGGISRILDETASENGRFYIAAGRRCPQGKRGRPVGILAVIEAEAGRFEIRSIFVEEVRRRSGVGRMLIDALVREAGDPVIEVEVGGDDAGFFHSLGFRIFDAGVEGGDSGGKSCDTGGEGGDSGGKSCDTGGKGGDTGVMGGDVGGFRCVYDHMNWEPLPYTKIVKRLQDAGVACWVSGGWALDIFLGRQTREHKDTDVTILRKDQAGVRDAFSSWEIYHTHAPGLRFWRAGELPESAPNVWLRRNRESAWAFEVMFQESDGGDWVYRRNRAIRRPIEDIGLVDADGTPFLKPELQLLFKGGGTSYRKTDLADLESVLPHLDARSRAWLLDSLRTEFPGGHDWLEIIRRSSPPTG